jgi:acetyl esterase/lipase
MDSLFRGMDRPALDEAYNNVRAVTDFPSVLGTFQARSAAAYERAEWVRDVAYGGGDRELFDLTRSSTADAPTIIYVHGGYWQTLKKEDFAFASDGLAARGFNVVLAEYALAPQASMTEIVDQIGRLLDFLSVSRNGLDIGHGPVALVGHSAGGHLSLLHRSHRLLHHVMAISPLVDLEPISLSWLNDKLSLTADEVDRYSPVRHIGPGGNPMTIAVGSAELAELVRHAREYHAAAIGQSERADYALLPDRDHFSVLEELASPTGILTTALVRALTA